MDNLLSPAYPLVAQLDEQDNKYFTVADMDFQGTGFTKLELASLMIAQGFVARVGIASSPGEIETIAHLSTILAKVVLTEANNL